MPRRSCWVLGRYSKWLLERADSGQRGELDAVVQGVCERLLDHNRRVQVGSSPPSPLPAPPCALRAAGAGLACRPSALPSACMGVQRGSRAPGIEWLLPPP